MLQHEHFVAKIGFDTAENGPSKENGGNQPTTDPPTPTAQKISTGTRLAKDPRRAATKINAATNAASSFSPLRVCLSSAQAQQMLCEDDPSRKNKMTAFSTLLVDGASATRES